MHRAETIVSSLCLTYFNEIPEGYSGVQDSGDSLVERFGLVDLILSEGSLEILELLKDTDVGYFKDFRGIHNERTGKLFSANTISTRLKVLVTSGAIQRIVSVSKKGRNVVAYKITPAGLKTLELADRFEVELRKFLKP